MSSFDALPSDVVLMIFASLHPTSTVMLVCKRFRDLALRVWHALLIEKGLLFAVRSHHNSYFVAHCPVRKWFLPKERKRLLTELLLAASAAGNLDALRHICEVLKCPPNICKHRALWNATGYGNYAAAEYLATLDPTLKPIPVYYHNSALCLLLRQPQVEEAARALRAMLRLRDQHTDAIRGLVECQWSDSIKMEMCAEHYERIVLGSATGPWALQTAVGTALVLLCRAGRDDLALASVDRMVPPLAVGQYLVSNVLSRLVQSQEVHPCVVRLLARLFCTITDAQLLRYLSEYAHLKRAWKQEAHRLIVAFASCGSDERERLVLITDQLACI